MREIFYSPTAGEDLYRLRATPAELTGIHALALLLAEGSKRGFLLPLQSPFLAAEERLYRYDVRAIPSELQAGRARA